MHDSSAIAIADAAEKGFAAGGTKGLLEAVRLQQQELYNRGLFSPYFLAETYAIAGRKQEALRYLQIAYDQHCDGMPQMESTRGFDSLHDEPAFRRMLAKVGLPPLT